MCTPNKGITSEEIEEGLTGVYPIITEGNSGGYAVIAVGEDIKVNVLYAKDRQVLENYIYDCPKLVDSSNPTVEEFYASLDARIPDPVKE